MIVQVIWVALLVTIAASNEDIKFSALYVNELIKDGENGVLWNLNLFMSFYGTFSLTFCKMEI